MPQYLVSIYRPDHYDGAAESETMTQQIDALNRDMVAAGVRRLACGLTPPRDAKTVALSQNSVSVQDGSYKDGTEHVGGFWILETSSMDEALTWAQKGAVACQASCEVREILSRPPVERPAVLAD